MEKLTKEIFRDLWDNSDTSARAFLNAWSSIEADREAVREDARAEILKTHFKAGEEIEVLMPGGAWVKATVGATRDISSSIQWVWTVFEFRRPQKMRPMTRGEKIKSLRGMSDDPMWRIEVGPLDRNKLKDETIDDLCRVAGIPTEVEEA